MQVFGLRRICCTPRSFQQACRASTATIGRNRKLRARSAQQPPCQLQPRRSPVDRDNDDQLDVKWFEQDVETGQTRRVAGNPEEMEATQLKSEIRQLEDELRSYESDEGEIDETMLEILEPADRAKVEAYLAKKDARETALTTGLEIPTELPPLTVPILNRLNKCLREAALHPGHVVKRKELWRWYCRAKRHVPALSTMVPRRAWEVMWDTLSPRTMTNPDRESHLLEISDDMMSAGVELSPTQKHSRQTSLVILERNHQAWEEWQAEYDATAGRDRTNLERGIVLFAQTGRINRATEVLTTYMEGFSEADPRVIQPLITATVKVGQIHRAYALYMYMRSKLKQNMQMTDYDIVVSAFMENNRTDLALAVFRDMMLQGSRTLQQGHIAEGSETDENIYKSIFRRIDNMQSHVTQGPDINKINLTALGSLPFRWQNKYFYASWIKKLLGEGHVSYASKVVELMFERGLRPDAIHVNGLIGAYMRSGERDLQQQGEELAWSMIQKRLELVSQRREGVRFVDLSTITETDDGRSIRIPLKMSKPLPFANEETFNVLGLHYLVKENWSTLRLLQRTMKDAEITMRSHFLNHLLYMQLYTNGPEPTWRDFVKNTETVKPDLETYNCLWTAELRHQDAQRRKMRSSFPSSRQLFNTMIEWHNGLPNKQKGDVRRNFELDNYSKIIQAFCQVKDYFGCLVAMHAIAQRFDAYPGPEIARILTDSISNIPEIGIPSIRGRRDRRQLPVDKARAETVAKLLEALSKRRERAARENGIDLDKADSKARSRESINLLSELLRLVLVRTGGKLDQIESLIEKASREMGVPGITTGDVDVTNIQY
ncbi:hypothetical protein MBLNU457_7613t1 [Dothideomycetes sp. NU457]